MDNGVNEQVTPNVTPVTPQPPVVNLPEEYTPISMWGYFGYQILFALPCIGFILLCVFSFGGTKNVNLKNFARSYFCFIIIFAIFMVIFMVLFGGLAAFGAMSSNPSYY